MKETGRRAWRWLARVLDLVRNGSFGRELPADLTSALPYGQMRAVWTVWRMQRDLRSGGRRTFLVRALSALAVAGIAYFMVLTGPDDFLVYKLFAMCVAAILFLAMVFGIYWLSSPAQIHALMLGQIDERNEMIKQLHVLSCHDKKLATEMVGDGGLDSEARIARNLERIMSEKRAPTVGAYE